MFVVFQLPPLLLCWRCGAAWYSAEGARIVVANWFPFNLIFTDFLLRFWMTFFFLCLQLYHFFCLFAHMYIFIFSLSPVFIYLLFLCTILFHFSYRSSFAHSSFLACCFCVDHCTLSLFIIYVAIVAF